MIGPMSGLSDRYNLRDKHRLDVVPCAIHF